MSSLSLFALLGVIFWILTLSVDGQGVNNDSTTNGYYRIFAIDLSFQCNITNLNSRPIFVPASEIHFLSEGYFQLNTSNRWIAYVNCNDRNYGNYISLAQKNNTSAVILYSNNSKQCEPPSNTTRPLFSLSQGNDKMCQNRTFLESKIAIIKSFDEDNYNGNTNNEPDHPTPPQDSNMVAATYQTAMIILYSVSGIVLGLFFIIVVVNLIRSRLYPPSQSASGNHNNPGNGIAKSVLDSFPVYLFALGNGNKVSEDSKVADASSEPALESLKVINERGLESTGETEVIDQTPLEGEEKDIGSAVDKSTDDAVANVSENSQIEDSSTSSAFNKITDEQLTCPICLGDFESGEELRILPCHHQYHTVCIDPWLLDSSPLCPMCKTDYTSWNKELQSLNKEDGLSSLESANIEPRSNGNDSSHHIFPHFRWIRYLTAIRRAGGRRRRDRRARVRHSEGGGEGNQRPQDDDNDTAGQEVGHGLFRASV